MSEHFLDNLQELRQGLEEVSSGTPLKALQEEYGQIERGYRTARPLAVIDSLLRALAYALVRMPATTSVLRTVFSELSRLNPSFSPIRMYDVGSGSGSAVWAGLSEWPSIAVVSRIEGQREMAELGDRLLAKSSLVTDREVSFCDEVTDFRRARPAESANVDLWVSSYALNEVTLNEALAVLEVASSSVDNSGFIVIVEPGTPAAFSRVHAYRRFFLERGYFIWAPCVGQAPCGSDWCHFSLQVQRSRLHRLVKGGSAPFEFEHYSYLVVSKLSPDRAPTTRRLVDRTVKSKHSVKVATCGADCIVRCEEFSKRAVGKEEFKRISKLEWGDVLY